MPFTGHSLQRGGLTSTKKKQTGLKTGYANGVRSQPQLSSLDPSALPHFLQCFGKHPMGDWEENRMEGAGRIVRGSF